MWFVYVKLEVVMSEVGHVRNCQKGVGKCRKDRNILVNAVERHWTSTPTATILDCRLHILQVLGTVGDFGDFPAPWSSLSEIVPRLYCKMRWKDLERSREFLMRWLCGACCAANFNSVLLGRGIKRNIKNSSIKHSRSRRGIRNWVDILWSKEGSFRFKNLWRTFGRWVLWNLCGAGNFPAWLQSIM